VHRARPARHASSASITLAQQSVPYQPIRRPSVASLPAASSANRNASSPCNSHSATHLLLIPSWSSSSVLQQSYQANMDRTGRRVEQTINGRSAGQLPGPSYVGVERKALGDLSFQLEWIAGDASGYVRQWYDPIPQENNTRRSKDRSLE
jgi:hypothetical protein